jgi:hypothetical protein
LFESPTKEDHAHVSRVHLFGFTTQEAKSWGH